MRIVIGAVGRMKAGAERDLCARYLERAHKMGPGLGFSGPHIVEIDEARARRAHERRDDEAARLAAAIGGGASLVALDEAGKTMTSRDLADLLGKWRDDGAPAAAFALGGPDGHGAAISAAANATLSFGRMTWPHMLARIMVTEQIYRAMTMLAGHPYHRA